MLDSFAPIVLGGTGIWSILVGTDALRVGGHFSTVNGAVEERFTQFKVQSAVAPTPAPTSAATLIAKGSAWSYRDDGVAPDASWTSGAYDDSTWKRGRAQLGFGDGDEATVMSSGKLTYWMRTSVDVADLSGHSSATLSLLRDDGAVVYVNGVEVVRSNMPSGTITATTPASTAVSGTEESTFTQHAIPLSVLQSGRNVVAVEVHQSSAGSSDVSFDLALDVS